VCLDVSFNSAAEVTRISVVSKELSVFVVCAVQCLERKYLFSIPIEVPAETSQHNLLIHNHKLAKAYVNIKYLYYTLKRAFILQAA
jgi:hypothetical protein